jgi:wyosine [tRNA(Phe)-imidazoG37] synthetase (radical SAM superfamily)
VVTVTGVGEPTLNSSLPEILNFLKSTVNHPLALLTNTTTIGIPEVRKVLHGFDIIVPSLDAVDEDVFDMMVHPHRDVNLKEIIGSLISFSHEYSGRLLLELLLVKGVNDSDKAISNFINVASQIKFEMIHLNTVFRPPAYPGVKRLSTNELENIYLKFKRSGLRVSPVGAFEGIFNVNGEIDLEKILSVVSKRPLTVEDLACSFGTNINAIKILVEELLKKRLATVKYYDGENYITINP